MEGQTTIWRMIAKLMILKDRATSYYSVFNYLLTMLTYLQVFGWNPMSLLLVGAGFLVIVAITAIDWYKIFPEVQSITWEKNPEWMKSKNRGD